RVTGAGLRCLREASYPSQRAPSLPAMVHTFLRHGRERPATFAVGVAGPVIAGHSQLTNLPWAVDEAELSAAFGFQRTRVLNDLEATGWAIGSLRGKQLASLTPAPRARPGNAAIIAAGTGLGMAILVRDGGRWLVLASEGGHQEFAPRDSTEEALLRFVRRELGGRVSVERLVSGDGLARIYRFLTRTGRAREGAAMRRRVETASDPNATISEAGLAGRDRASARALALFVQLYGAAAGNLALVARATGGMFLAGGIAPRILPALRAGAFLRAFRDKGRLSPLLAAIPIKVVLEPRAALLGAAACAADLRRVP
ncbi:MAG TPA: glucokinase, partial [Candidatus Polarisedimenticolaceae bacterium]|nr:glucokinase [Candidatus Polarisedimenticolaceae bacterium]